MKAIRSLNLVMLLGLTLLGLSGAWGQSREGSAAASEKSRSGLESTPAKALLPDALRGWTYADDFTTDQVAAMSCLHSALGNETATASQPVLVRVGSGSARGLALVGYDAEPATLVFCTPPSVAGAGRVLFGRVQVRVARSAVTVKGQVFLHFSYSSDARHWSPPQALGEGVHDLVTGPLIGAAYVSLSGSGLVLEDLRVTLGPPARTRLVSAGASLQAAIDQAGDGEVIDVGPGTYAGGLSLRGKGLVLRAAQGPEVTRIQCRPGQRGITVSGGADPVVIEGFTIAGGDVTQTAEREGGGLRSEGSAIWMVGCRVEQCRAQAGGAVACVGGEAVIADCRVQDNVASVRGGGVALLGGVEALIMNTSVLDNAATFGGGVVVEDSGFATGATEPSTWIRGSVLAFNGADGSVLGGGALYATGAALRLRLENCILARNGAGRGAALLAESASVSADHWSLDLRNCTIADNGPSVSVVEVTQGRTQLKSCIVWNNSGQALRLPAGQHNVNFSCLTGGFPGVGNLSLSPRFRDTTAVAGRLPDYRLRPDSPCVDAGDLFCPVGLEPAPNGNRVNMGAFGGTVQAVAGGRVLHVDAAGGRDVGHTGLTRGQAYQRIQRAVDAAQPGDAVVIWPGLYTESVSIPDLPITIQGAVDPPVVRGGAQAAFSLVGQHGPDTILRNLIITDSNPAVYCNYAFPTILNLTLVGNAGGILSQPPEPDISGCILWSNGWDLWGCSASFSCVQRLDVESQKRGSFAANPRFALPEIGDYHLQSRGGRFDPLSGGWVADLQDSPAVDAADPAYCADAEIQGNGSRVNIGAYGGTPYASMARRQVGIVGGAAQQGAATWLSVLPLAVEDVDLDVANYLNSIRPEGVSKAGRGDIIGL